MRDSAVRCELTCRYELARVVSVRSIEEPVLASERGGSLRARRQVAACCPCQHDVVSDSFLKNSVYKKCLRDLRASSCLRSSGSRESRIPNPESRIPNPESRIPNPETRSDHLGRR